MVTATNAPADKNAVPVIMLKSVQSQVVIMSGLMPYTVQMAATTDIATPVNQIQPVASTITPNNAKRPTQAITGVQACYAHLDVMAMVYVMSVVPENAAAMATIKRSATLLAPDTSGQRLLVITAVLMVTATSVPMVRRDVRAITLISALTTALTTIGLMSHCVPTVVMRAIVTSANPMLNAV
jgi:hypothetical protein